MDGEPPAPGGQELGQGEDLVLGLGGGVGVAEEVDHLQGHPPLGHHPGGHGAVNPPGQEGDRLAPHPHRQAAGAGGGVPVDVGGKVPHLHVDGELRVVHVRLDVGEGLVELPPHVLGELDGGQGEGLVRPLGLHLKGPGGHQVVVEVGLGGFEDGLGGLFAGLGPGQAHHPEQAGEGGEGPVHVAPGLLGLHVGDGLAGVDAELAVLLQPAAGVAHEPLLKGAAVEALEDHLSHLEQKDLIAHRGRAGNVRHSG